MAEIAPDTELTAGKLLLVEYQALKEEQRQRIGVRDNLVYATLAAMAAVGAVALQGARNIGVLLVLQPVCLVLGWTYLINDQKVSAIGRYVRDDLTPRLVTLAPGAAPVFGWEAVHRADKRRLSRKLLQLGVELTLFCLTGFVALIVYWSVGPASTALMVVSVLEMLAAGGLAVQFVLYAELRRDGAG